MTKETNVVGMNGQPVKQEKGKRNPVVAELVKRVGERNRNGQVDAIICITIAPDGTPTQYSYGLDDPFIFPVAITALAVAQQTFLHHAIANADVDYIEGE